jgi:3-isopropylmalate dehydrogenase
MMLEESAGMREEAALIVAAVRQSWKEGYRTADLMAPGRRLVGTKEMGEVISRNIVALAGNRRSLETAAPAR